MDKQILHECLEAALQLQEVFDTHSENFKKCADDINILISHILKHTENGL